MSKGIPNATERAERMLTESFLTLKEAAAVLAPDTAVVARVLTDALKGGSKVLLCGNGGSAADAQHIAAELAGRLRRERPGLPAIALTVNASILTAVSNDYGYDLVFARQVEALGQAGDVLIGISTSASSPNVVRALIAARDNGLTTIGLTGRGGGDMEEHCDHILKAPASDTQRVQEVHMAIGHVICELVESELFGD